ncbi:hypothetical protein [Paraburkholderia aromaticivorans]|uniref:hypothetical protein n=1 Tax=Paraburkholderia aromaticivorans TaxID=2026199 RepID=UPI0038B723A5
MKETEPQKQISRTQLEDLLDFTSIRPVVPKKKEAESSTVQPTSQTYAGAAIIGAALFSLVSQNFLFESLGSFIAIMAASRLLTGRSLFQRFKSPQKIEPEKEEVKSRLGSRQMQFNFCYYSPETNTKLATDPRAKWVRDIALQCSERFSEIVRFRVHERNAWRQERSDRAHGRGYRFVHDKFSFLPSGEQVSIRKQALDDINTELDDEKSTWLARTYWKEFIHAIVSSGALDYLTNDQLEHVIQAHYCSDEYLTRDVRQEFDALFFSLWFMPLLALPLFFIPTLPLWCSAFVFIELCVGRKLILNHKKSGIVTRCMDKYNKRTQKKLDDMKTEIARMIEQSKLQQVA